jgi:hypothetical protein
MSIIEKELEKIITGEGVADDENRFKITFYHGDKESSIIVNEEGRNRMVTFLERKSKDRDSTHYIVSAHDPIPAGWGCDPTLCFRCGS